MKLTGIVILFMTTYVAGQKKVDFTEAIIDGITKGISNQVGQGLLDLSRGTFGGISTVKGTLYYDMGPLIKEGNHRIFITAVRTVFAETMKFAVSNKLFTQDIANKIMQTLHVPAGDAEEIYVEQCNEKNKVNIAKLIPIGGNQTQADIFRTKLCMGVVTQASGYPEFSFIQLQERDLLDLLIGNGIIVKGTSSDAFRAYITG